MTPAPSRGPQHRDTGGVWGGGAGHPSTGDKPQRPPWGGPNPGQGCRGGHLRVSLHPGWVLGAAGWGLARVPRCPQGCWSPQTCRVPYLGEHRGTPQHPGAPQRPGAPQHPQTEQMAPRLSPALPSVPRQGAGCPGGATGCPRGGAHAARTGQTVTQTCQERATASPAAGQHPGDTGTKPGPPPRELGAVTTAGVPTLPQCCPPPTSPVAMGSPRPGHRVTGRWGGAALEPPDPSPSCAQRWLLCSGWSQPRSWALLWGGRVPCATLCHRHVRVTPTSGLPSGGDGHPNWEHWEGAGPRRELPAGSG